MADKPVEFTPVVTDNVTIDEQFERFCMVYCSAGSMNMHKTANITGFPISKCEMFMTRKDFKPALMKYLERDVVSYAVVRRRIVRDGISVATYNALDAFVVNDDGTVSIDPDMPEECKRAITGIKIRRDNNGNGDMLEVKFADKVPALRMVGEWFQVKDEVEDLDEVYDDTGKLGALTIELASDGDSVFRVEDKTYKTVEIEEDGSIYRRNSETGELEERGWADKED